MRRKLPAIAGMTLAALLLAPAVAAAHDPDWEGWFVYLDAALVTPGNTDTAVMATGAGPFVFTPIETSVEKIDWDDDPAFRAGFGYAFGSRGTLKVTYWTYDDTSESEGSVPSYYAGGGYNFWTIGPQGSIGSAYFFYDQDWSFEQEIEARTVDIEYVRSAGDADGLVVHYGAGLRYASLEETVDGRYVVDPSGVPAVFPATRHLDGDAIGLTGSVGADYSFTDTFGLRCGLRVGFLTSDVDQEHRVVDASGYYLAPGEAFSQEVSSEDDIATTIDFDVGVTFHTGPYLDIDVGWLTSVWMELPAIDLARTSAFLGQPVLSDEDRDKLSWSGGQVKLTFHF